MSCSSLDRAEAPKSTSLVVNGIYLVLLLIPAILLLSFTPAVWAVNLIASETTPYGSDYQANGSTTSEIPYKTGDTGDDSAKGALNGDGEVNLADAILSLQVLSGNSPAGIRSDYVSSGADVNGDNKIGLEEILFILQKVSSLRNLLPRQIYPVNGATHVDPDYIMLLWFAPSSDIHCKYDVQISTRSDFNTIVEEENDTFNKWLLPFGIQRNHTYWWRVRVSATYDGSSWVSDVSDWVTESFSTDPVINANGPDDLTFEKRLVLTTGDGPTCLVAADFDADGKTDLATADKDSKKISIFRNTSSGTGNLYFAGSVSLEVPDPNAWDRYTSHLIVPGDFDCDGKIDIAAGLHSSADAYISIFLNTSSGPGNISFTDSGCYYDCGVYMSVKDIGVGDFDGDGKLDLVNATGNYRIFIRRNSSSCPGSISFEDHREFSMQGLTWTRSLAVNDFDKDGRVDFTFTNGNANLPETKGGVWRNTYGGMGDISFSHSCELVAVVDGRFPDSIVAADFDIDGSVDVAALSGGIDTVFLFRNTTAAVGEISFSLDAESLSTNSYPTDVVAADFNGDGKIDIATADQYSNKISVFRNQSGRGVFFFPGDRISFDTGDGPNSIVAADFDGDGLPDLATCDRDSNEVSVFRNSY